LPDDLKLSPLGRGPTRWYVRTVWEEYTGWFRMDLTSELYATPVSAIGLDLAELAGGVDAIRHRADELRRSGELEKALHMIEVAVAAAPDDRAVRETEGHILVDLINRTGGVGFDEIGWLEGKLREAASVANAEG
jgi:alkyl sulfatase BDS1-like metallo-beta-lactamase superfamily hydrolase